MSIPAHSASPAGATHDAVLHGFFRPPRRSLFVMHLPGREPHREPHTLTFFTIATSSNAPSEGNPRSPHREGLKADPSTIHEVAGTMGCPLRVWIQTVHAEKRHVVSQRGS